MSFRKIAERGEKHLAKANQHHQMPNSAFDMINTGYENTIYGVSFSCSRTEHIDFVKELSRRIPDSSIVNSTSDNLFVEDNLKYEFRNHKKIKVERNMIADIDCGNPKFYERTTKTNLPQTGTSLVYDKHIMNAVKNLSGRIPERGPYITDTTWFQGGGSQGKFRDWLFSPEFGLKTIILLPSKEFDVDSGATELCMFNGTVGYDGLITVIDYETKKEFSCDFRKIGKVISDSKLAKLLPDVKTNTEYEWKRVMGIDLKFDKDENLIKGPKEVKGGSVKVLKRLRLGAEPEYYYTDPEFINDWTDSDKERFVTRYQPATQKSDDSNGGRLWYKIAVGTVVEPGTIVPGNFWFTYVNVEKGTGETHKKHLMSNEVTSILKKTRQSRSLHTPQTVWIPYATEFKGWTEFQKEIINEL